MRERIWPLLVEENRDIENTKVFLQVFEMVIQRAFMQKRIETSISDLKLEDELRNNPEAERYHKMFSIINTETVDAASDLMKSMGLIIDNHIRDEGKNRKVSELNLKYFDAS